MNKCLPYCQKVLPLTYDDSLSYYECICKLTNKVNEFITNDEKYHDYIEDLIKQLPANLSSIVCVNDYGAKGDGSTDDTKAIQTCIDSNPTAHIFFKKGTYIVSDTIKIPTAGTGCFIDLGGSIIKFSDNATPLNAITPLFITSIDGTISSNSILANGTIDGNLKCGIGVQNTTYYFTLNNIRIVNFTHIGVLTGELNSSKTISSQCLYNNVTINQILGDWSNEETYGMYFVNTDNLINNVNINRYGCGIMLKTGGNEFNNIHITLQYHETNISPDNYNGANIINNPISVGSTQFNVFNNCYFNAGKYVIKDISSAFNRMTYILNNCQYIFYLSDTILSERMYAFLFSGKYGCYVHVNGFKCIHGDNITFLKFFPYNNVSSLEGINTFKNIYSYNILRGGLLDINNTNELKLNGYTLAPGHFLKIGCILRKISISSTSNNGTSIMEITPFSGNIAKTVFNRSSNVWTSFTDDNFSKIAFFVDNTPTSINIGGRTMHYFNIYIKNKNSSSISDALEIKLNGVLSNNYFLYPVYNSEMVVDVDESSLTKIL